MKITIFNPQSEFTEDQQKKLSSLGEVVYTKDRSELPISKLLEMANGADILGVDPDPLGGFEKAKPVLTKIMESLPKLKGLTLDTADLGWVDLEYCKKRNIPVLNIKGGYREAVAEHTVGLLICLAKKIIVSDRKTQLGNYVLELGFELKGKTLGIIGLGSIGSRVAELARGIGMNVIACSHSHQNAHGVSIVSLDNALRHSDALSLHVTHSDENNNLIGQPELSKVKNGVIIINTADRSLVDEYAMADAIQSGKVTGYAYEAEDLKNTPLAGLENVIGLKPFGWYTKEALRDLFQTWVDNIIAIGTGEFQSTV